MNSSELKKAKREVRRRVLAKRDSLSQAEREDQGRLVVERFLALPEVAAADIVLAFWSFGSELPTAPLLDALCDRGSRVALPRMVGRELDARLWAPGDPTTETPFGAREPVGGVVVAPDEIDVIATPAVAFDRKGRRVGYGGGFYDRFLLATRSDALRVGIAFDVQLLDEELPGGDFDLRVDLVVTGSETLRCARQ
jgi:5,10-methenyltetrahydrofolate synthetase